MWNIDSVWVEHLEAWMTSNPQSQKREGWGCIKMYLSPSVRHQVKTHSDTHAVQAHVHTVLTTGVCLGKKAFYFRSYY